MAPTRALTMARSRGSVMAGAPVRPVPPGLEAGAAAAPGRGPAPSGPPGATVQAGLGPVGLGHRDQLGHLQAVGGGLADQGGGGVLVAVAGGRGHGQPQPMPGRRRPGRLRRRGWPEPSPSASGGGSMARCPLEAAQGLLAGRLGLDPGAGTGQDLSGPPGPGQGHHGVGACPVAVADGGAGDHQVLEAAPGDVPGLAFAGLLHRAGLDPGALPDPGRAVPGRPLGVEPPGLLDHLDHPGGAQQGVGVGHGVEEQAARAGPDQAALLGLIPQPVRATGRDR